MTRPLDVQWIHGSPDCATNTDPSLQIHAFDEDTCILRQNKCHSFEAPFLYLLFGSTKALLLDTGDWPRNGGHFPLREIVQGLVAGRTRRGRALELVVAHTHGHGDHVFGDDQFNGLPHTTVVPPTLDGVRDFFGLTHWPEQPVRFDLGGRPLTILPTPGHADDLTDVAVYDPRTQLVFSGDTFYPGYLYVRDWKKYRASIDRLVRFAAAHPVRYFLGAHIEMTRTKKVAYPSGTAYQPKEHVLQLLPRHLAKLHATLKALGDVPAEKVLDDFILKPIGV